MSPNKTANRLSKDVVVNCALELADTEGLDAVTIRRLATELDVTPMALYWHFKTKDDLLAGLGDRLLDGLSLPTGRGGWQHRIEQAIRSLVAAMRTHPAAATLAAHRLLLHPNGLAVTEAALAALDEAGFTQDEAAQIAINAMNTAITLVTSPQVEPADEAVLRSKTASIRSLDPARYPHVIAFADQLTRCADDEQFFALGVDLFVAGVQGLAPKRKRS